MPFKYEDAASVPAASFKYDAPATPPAPKETDYSGLIADIIKLPSAVGEAGLNLISSAVAKPVSDVVGLGTIIADITGMADADPAKVKAKVQSGMTYQPRIPAGQAISQYNPLALAGKAVDWAGRGAEGIIAPPGAGPVRQAIGSGVREATAQAPGLIGIKAPPVLNAAGQGMRGTAEGLMTSALKPTLAQHQSGKAQTAVDTLLDEGINVTPGGVAKLQDKINSLNTEITSRVQASTKIIDKAEVAKRLDKVFSDFERQVTPTTDLVAIQRAYDDFMNHPLLNGNDIPVPLAQEMKQGTYRALGDKAYGELKGADMEAQKALARGLKEEIAKAVPEVHQLNAKESKLLDTLDVTERRALMDANKNPIGLGWLTTDPAKFAGWMTDRSPLFKSLVARMLNQASKVPPALSAGAPATGIGVSEYGMMPPPPGQQ